MKKLLSGLLTIVMFIALIGTLSLIGVRGALSSSSIGKMIDTMIEDYNFFESTGIAEVEELEELMEEDKEFKKLFSGVVADTLKYTIRISDEMPEYEGLFEYIVDETDIEVEEDDIEIAIEELEEQAKAERLSEDDEGVAVVQTLFSIGSLLSGIVVVILSLLGICALTKNVGKGVKRLGCTAAAAGLALYGLSTLIISFISQEATGSEAEMLGLVEVMLSPFGTVGVISIIIGIILAILSPKIAQTFASIDHSNQAIQNLDNSVIKR